MLYTKYQGSMPCCFIQENCFMFSLYKGKKGDKDQESIQSYEQTRENDIHKTYNRGPEGS